MAVLKAIGFSLSGDLTSSLMFTVPPVIKVETIQDRAFDGYITGVTGTEFLPQTMITTPKAFGGSHFHGFNVVDREVVVTFHPIAQLGLDATSRPSVLRDKINRVSSRSRTLGYVGNVWFEISSFYDPDSPPIRIGNKAEISSFEFNSFGGSTESKIAFKMPDPYFLTDRRISPSPSPVVVKRVGNNTFEMSKNSSFFGDAGVEGEFLYEITITLGGITKGQSLVISGNDVNSDPFVIHFLQPQSAGQTITIRKDDVLNYTILSTIPSSHYLSMGRPPRMYQERTRAYSTISSKNASITKVELNSYAIALEGF